MTHSEALKRDLASDTAEGLRLTVYDDATAKPLRKGDTIKGFPSIGVGRNLSGKGITKVEAFYLLDNDISECVTDLVMTWPWFERLDAVRQRMLIELRMNLGPTGFRKFQPTLNEIANGQYGVAADRLLAAPWSDQVQPSRRDRMLRMLRTGVADDGG